MKKIVIGFVVVMMFLLVGIFYVMTATNPNFCSDVAYDTGSNGYVLGKLARKLAGCK